MQVDWIVNWKMFSGVVCAIYKSFRLLTPVNGHVPVAVYNRVCDGLWKLMCSDFHCCFF